MNKSKEILKGLMFHYGQILSYYLNKPICPPKIIHFIPTKRCNLNCKYCNIWKEGNIKTELDAKTWIRIADEIHDWVGDAHIGVTGGEPLLRKDIFDILNHMKKIGLNISLTTNGIFVNKEEIIKNLVKLEPFNINFSIESLDPEEHGFFRGKNNLEKTCQNLLDLKKELIKNNSPTLVIVETTLTQKNITSVKPLVEFCIKNNLKIHFGNVIENLAMDYKGDYKTESEYKPKQEDSQKIIETFDYLDKIRKKTNMILSSSSALNMIRDYYLGKKIKFKCVANVRNLVIDTDGSVKLCVHTPQVGNVKNSDIKDIWFSEKANEMRKFMKNCKKICQFYCNKQRSLFEEYEMYKAIFR